MESKDILQRYFEAQTSPNEEQLLAEALAQSNKLSPEERAAEAMMAYAAQQREGRVAVRLRNGKQGVRRWQMALAAACVVVIAVGAWMNRPKPYCYVNGRPIYSIDEARRYAEGMFNDLAMAELPQINSLEELFTLE
jgi:hypothetical protein